MARPGGGGGEAHAEDHQVLEGAPGTVHVFAHAVHVPLDGLEVLGLVLQLPGSPRRGVPRRPQLLHRPFRGAGGFPVGRPRRFQLPLVLPRALHPVALHRRLPPGSPQLSPRPRQFRRRRRPGPGPEGPLQPLHARGRHGGWGEGAKGRAPPARPPARTPARPPRPAAPRPAPPRAPAPATPLRPAPPPPPPPPPSPPEQPSRKGGLGEFSPCPLQGGGAEGRFSACGRRRSGRDRPRLPRRRAPPRSRTPPGRPPPPR